ncbi:YdcF family protein [Brucella sp. BE17]|uniref:YdcF family protein n=1 Tax=Brucella sp. BE17 TaxID=3142977 RepID=UPI0031B9F396
MNPSILSAAQMLWDYHCIYDPVPACDVIVGLGSYDLRVAERAADLYLEGLAPWLIFSGKSGNFTQNRYPSSEAEAFARVAIARGVPEKAIVLETQATNIGENIRFSLCKMVPGVVSPIFVTKPQTQRRVQATVPKQWPQAKARVTAPLTPFEDQPTADFPLDMLIHEMTGDLERILDYPAKGYQIPQAVPLKVMEAYDYLIAQGFTGHAIG